MPSWYSVPSGAQLNNHQYRHSTETLVPVGLSGAMCNVSKGDLEVRGARGRDTGRLDAHVHEPQDSRINGTQGRPAWDGTADGAVRIVSVPVWASATEMDETWAARPFAVVMASTRASLVALPCYVVSVSWRLRNVRRPMRWTGARRRWTSIDAGFSAKGVSEKGTMIVSR